MIYILFLEKCWVTSIIINNVLLKYLQHFDPHHQIHNSKDKSYISNISTSTLLWQGSK